MTSGAYADGSLAEVFLKLGKQGSTLAGVMDAFSIAVSIGLQYGVPLETFVEKFANQRFEPAGMTDEEEFQEMQCSTCVSEGHLFHKDDKVVMTFSSYEIENEMVTSFGDRNVYPIGVVTKIEYL